MKKVVYITAAIVIVLIFAAVLVTSYFNQTTRENVYNYSVSMIRNGSYEAALEGLEEVNPDKLDREDFLYNITFYGTEGYYRDSVYIYAYAMARIDYGDEKNGLSGVNRYLELIPEDYSGELCEEIADFKKSFKPEYEEYLAEAERYRREQEAKERLSYANKLPYEGMNEKYIDDTLMGKHHDYKREVVGGGTRWESVIHIYRWNNIEGDTILYVDCEDGVVKDVTKFGVDYFWTTDGKPIYSAVNPYRHRKKTTTKKEEKSDPYDVYDYSNPEDFYDDNYDDFFDYEEAEDYYNEHHD